MRWPFISCLGIFQGCIAVYLSRFRCCFSAATRLYYHKSFALSTTFFKIFYFSQLPRWTFVLAGCLEKQNHLTATLLSSSAFGILPNLFRFVNTLFQEIFIFFFAFPSRPFLALFPIPISCDVSASVSFSLRLHRCALSSACAFVPVTRSQSLISLWPKLNYRSPLITLRFFVFTLFCSLVECLFIIQKAVAFVNSFLHKFSLFSELCDFRHISSKKHPFD